MENSIYLRFVAFVNWRLLFKRHMKKDWRKQETPMEQVVLLRLVIRGDQRRHLNILL